MFLGVFYVLKCNGNTVQTNTKAWEDWATSGIRRQGDDNRHQDFSIPLRESGSLRPPLCSVLVRNCEVLEAKGLPTPWYSLAAGCWIWFSPAGSDKVCAINEK